MAMQIQIPPSSSSGHMTSSSSAAAFSNIEIRTKSVEQTLHPLVNQVILRHTTKGAVESDPRDPFFAP